MSPALDPLRNTAVRVLVEKGAAGAKRGDLNKAILVRVLTKVADGLCFEWLPRAYRRLLGMTPPTRRTARS